LRGQPTGAPICFNGDAVAGAKRDIKVCEILDGEGGYTVWGRLMPSTDSVAAQALPIGLASNVTVTRPVNQGQVITMDDIRADTTAQAWQVRHKMLAQFG